MRRISGGCCATRRRRRPIQAPNRSLIMGSSLPHPAAVYTARTCVVRVHRPRQRGPAPRGPPFVLDVVARSWARGLAVAFGVEI